MNTLYNDNDRHAAAWLRELIACDLLPLGPVFERPIQELTDHDLAPYETFHAFAGIGGWPYALQLAGWPVGQPVWTGSCPCQPFSCAGKRRGEKDERHLWPEFYRLISKCRPPTIFGEQVASPDGVEWLAGVSLDLEELGYAVASSDLPAASAGAPHNRPRLFWGASLGYPSSSRRPSWNSTTTTSRHRRPVEPASGGNNHGLVNPDSSNGFWWSGPLQVGWNSIEAEIARGGRKYRAQWRIKPGLSLLAYGIPGRVAQIRGFGNAIVPQVAAAFVRAFLDAERSRDS